MQHDVVGAHRDQVDVRWCSNRRMAPAMAVLVPTPSVALTSMGSRMPAGSATAPAKPPRPPSRLDRAEGSVDVRPQELDGAVAGADVDTGRRVGAGAPSSSRSGDQRSSSSTNLWEATS